MFEGLFEFLQPIGNIFGIDVKEWTNEQIDSYIAQIKNAIGTFYTFESAILEIKQKVNRGEYSSENANEVLSLLNSIQTRQSKLQTQVDNFVNLTGGVMDKYGNFELDKNYIKANWTSLISDGSIVYIFLTQTMSEIDKQKQEIQKLQSFLTGSSPLLYGLKEFFSKPKNIIMTLGGVWLVKKILK